MSDETLAHILLVDDHPENLLALETILGDLGQPLVLARSGREALRCLLQQDFAVILLDVQMPELDGFETAALIRARERSAHTPVIFITALSKTEMDMMRGYATGAVDYVIKPFVPEVLRAKVQAFVDLFRMREEVRRQADALAAANRQLTQEVAERQRAEAEVVALNRALQERARQLESLNEELESFAYSVSHDLRAPLRGIANLIRIVEEDHGGRLDADGRGLMQRIQAAATRMSEMIDGLLDLSRVSREELRRESVNLSDLAAAIAAELRDSAPQRAVEFVIAPGLVASGDPRLLHAALENLIGNAWKYTGKRATSRIEFGCTSGTDIAAPRFSSGTNGGQEEGQGSAPGGEAFFVRDDGVGFESGFAKHLFEPFRRLHAESEFPGLGIGLATVQRIIRRHGGRIWAESEVDDGATFYFTLDGP